MMILNRDKKTHVERSIRKVGIKVELRLLDEAKTIYRQKGGGRLGERLNDMSYSFVLGILCGLEDAGLIDHDARVWGYDYYTHDLIEEMENLKGLFKGE